MIKTILIQTYDVSYFEFMLKAELNKLVNKGLKYDVNYSTTSVDKDIFNSALIIYKEV